MKTATNWYGIALTTVRCWPIAAGICFMEFLRRVEKMPWYTVPAIFGAMAVLVGVAIAYCLLVDWLGYESEEWQRRRRNDC